MKNWRWLGQFGCLRTLLDRDDEVNDEYDNNDEDNEDAEDGDCLVQQRSDLINWWWVKTTEETSTPQRRCFIQVRRRKEHPTCHARNEGHARELDVTWTKPRNNA